MQSNRPRIVLFRAETPDDPYAHQLRVAGFAPEFVPVLQFRPINEERLRGALASSEAYSGLLLTSERAVTRVHSAISSLAPWRQLPLYVIGPRTRSLMGVESWSGPVVSATSGAKLARKIIAANRDPRPILFPCSSRRRDELPTTLAAASIAVEEIPAYATIPVQPEVAGDAEAPAWVVCFSPSGVEAVVPLLTDQWKSASRAAIGTTTAEAFDRAGLPARAVALEPEASALTDAILAAEEGGRASGR